MGAPPWKPVNCQANQNLSCPDHVSGITHLQLSSQTPLLTLSEFISKSSDPACALSRRVALVESAKRVKLGWVYVALAGEGMEVLGCKNTI